MNAIAIKTIEDLVEEGLVSGYAYKQYNDDKKLVVYEGYGSDEENIAIVGAYCEANGYEWCFDDSVVVDDDMLIAYTDKNDVIALDGEIVGRLGFEEGDYDFDCISDEFIDNHERILPTWFSDDELVKNGFEKMSCEFNSGWYEHNTNEDPKDIIARVKALDETKNIEVIFKLDCVSQFEIDYCVFVRIEE